MIPTKKEAYALWEKYALPEKKRRHVQLVCDTALFLAKKYQEKTNIHIDFHLLEVGALLHDIDKNIPRLPHEHHPQTGVRILKLEGMNEVADFIEFHSVQYIEFDATKPKTIESKLLYLADKMVKQEVITVDKRFSLWLNEGDLPETQKQELRRVYPKVKLLEKEIFDKIGINPEDVAQLLKEVN